MYVLDDVTFEKYLRAVLLPKELFAWGHSIPKLETPPFGEAERLYLKHHPQYEEQRGKVHAGYSWIWDGFKEEVESNAIDLNLSEADRKRYLKILSQWFESLEAVKEQYKQLLDALVNWKPLSPSPEDVASVESVGETVPEWDVEYFEHGEGTSHGRGKVGLDWCIYIIEEGKKLIDFYLNQYEPVNINNEQRAPVTPPAIVNKGFTNAEIKEYVRLILAPLGGLNPQNQSIINQTDLDRLIGYVDHLVLTDSLPSAMLPIKQPNISADHIRFTFYRLHKELFGTRRIRDSFIDFMHKVFRQFDGYAPKTTKARFSEMPKSYEKDFLG